MREVRGVHDHDVAVVLLKLNHRATTTGEVALNFAGAFHDDCLLAAGNVERVVVIPAMS